MKKMKKIIKTISVVLGTYINLSLGYLCFVKKLKENARERKQKEKVK